MGIFVDKERLCDEVRDCIQKCFELKYDEYGKEWREDKKRIGILREQAQKAESRVEELETILKIKEEKIKELEGKCSEAETKHQNAVKLFCDLKTKSEQTEADSSQKNAEIEELTSCLRALAEGVYNQDHIEFFALKTYRGWQYICYNGEKYLNLNDAIVTVYCKNGEKVTLNIRR